MGIPFAFATCSPRVVEIVWMPVNVSHRRDSRRELPIPSMLANAGALLSSPLSENSLPAINPSPYVIWQFAIDDPGVQCHFVAHRCCGAFCKPIKTVEESPISKTRLHRKPQQSLSAL